MAASRPIGRSGRAGSAPTGAEDGMRSALSANVVHALLDATPEALLAVAPDGRLVYSNAQAQLLFGWTRAELQDRMIDDLVPGARLDEAWPGSSHQGRTPAEPVSGAERWGKRSNGSQFPAELILNATDDGNGSVLVLVVVRELSARRRWVSAEQMLHELASNIEVGFAVRSLDPPEFQYLNAAYFRIFGFDPDGETPTPAQAMAIVHPDDVARLSEVLPSAATGRQSRHEWRVVHPDGTERWIAGTVSPITEDDGSVRRVAGIFEDRTDARAQDQARREAEELLSEFANSTELGMFVRDSTRVLYANDGMFRILGLDPSQPRSEPLDFRTMIHPDDREATGTAAKVASKERRTTNVEMRVVRPDGTLRWVRATNNPVGGPDDGLARVAVTVVDITERMAAEASERSARRAAERANAAKDEFLSRMSHELRTPLHAILGFAQLSKESEHDTDALDQVVAAGRHLLALVDEILDVAWMKSGSMRLDLEPVHPVDVISEAVAMLRPLALARDVVITVSTDSSVSDAVLVDADRQRLKQAIVNLLGNAVKYNRVGGSIRVTCALATAERLRLSISDSGVGIAEHDQALLFQPFERLSAHDSAVEGTGLGLAVTKYLVTAMHGEIGMASTVGVGSEFWIELPISMAPSESAGEPPRRADVARPDDIRSVLYIEDNVANIRLMERIMGRRPGVMLSVAELGRTGLERASATPPDLILLDLHLPDISGLEVLRRLRSNPVTAATPVVMLSADAQPSSRAQLLAAGATDYLTKPFDLEALLEVIDVVGRCRLPTETSPNGPGDEVVDDRATSLETDAVVDLSDRVMAFVHDLNNELGVILTLSELMQRSATDPTATADLEGVRIATERAVSMAAELMAGWPGRLPGNDARHSSR